MSPVLRIDKASDLLRPVACYLSAMAGLCPAFARLDDHVKLLKIAYAEYLSQSTTSRQFQL